MKNNIQQFKALILKYESITEEKINTVRDEDGYWTITKLTGFGFSNKCSLCRPLMLNGDPNCMKCIWSKLENNVHSLSQYCRGSKAILTYADIENASRNKDIKALIIACKERAKLMRKILTDNGYKQPKAK